MLAIQPATVQPQRLFACWSVPNLSARLYSCARTHMPHMLQFSVVKCLPMQEIHSFHRVLEYFAHTSCIRLGHHLLGLDASKLR